MKLKVWVAIALAAAIVISGGIYFFTHGATGGINLDPNYSYVTGRESTTGTSNPVCPKQVIESKAIAPYQKQLEAVQVQLNTLGGILAAYEPAGAAVPIDMLAKDTGDPTYIQEVQTLDQQWLQISSKISKIQTLYGC